MRAVDDPTEVHTAVLKKIERWGNVPESDLTRMLPQYYLVTNDFRHMEEEGYIEMKFLGDEYIISIAHLGKLFLEQQEKGTENKPESPEQKQE